MPSLKDLRNRIASVKATQKITKAMQMVAAAKLRRAQAAAEAARPYAERMDTVLANIAGHRRRARPAPALLAGTGSDEVHLLVVCTAERGLCGAFNSSIVRLAREHANCADGQGKTVKIFCVGKKGYDQLRRQFEQPDHRARSICAACAARLRERRDDRPTKVIALFEAGEFDVCTLFFSRFKSVIAQIPTAQQIIPAQVRGRRRQPPSGARLTNTSRTRTRSSTELLPRNIAVQIFRALLENTASIRARR